MIISTYFLIFVALILGAIFVFAFVYAVKTDQFKDVEEPKYQMMREDD